MSLFKDVKSTAGLSSLNDYLAHYSYIGGFQLSLSDSSVFDSFESSPSSQYPHIVRWFKNIESYESTERSTWPRAESSGTNQNGPTPTIDDEIDLFASDDDEEDAEKERIKEERLKVYAEKKAKKPGPIAKSNVIFDVKPWDDTIDVNDIEKCVRSIETDGLVWGASKFVPVAFGIRKLQICCVIVDDKVSTDWLEETITNFDDIVQSVDVVAFNKV